MDSVEYFNLADLWEQYYEWSAYGAGATVQLPGGDRVVQYYVPYLSGMQLYTNKVLTASRYGQDLARGQISSLFMVIFSCGPIQFSVFLQKFW
jgi:hypothetical protein